MTPTGDVDVDGRNDVGSINFGHQTVHRSLHISAASRENFNQAQQQNVSNVIPTALTVSPVSPLEHALSAKTASIQTSLIVNLVLIQIAKHVLIRYIVTPAETVFGVKTVTQNVQKGVLIENAILLTVCVLVL
ncbi:uncharacterized protein LOC128206311 [Mya arenaria]|uniref:uncharacterized protein LOC128206311 n=1 Tax=Mya arenaria TaxID=6604 RepID=UPI0022E1F610|nr:uncharacterized protein LOC128206311 [Mya arenaria]